MFYFWILIVISLVLLVPAFFQFNKVMDLPESEDKRYEEWK